MNKISISKNSTNNSILYRLKVAYKVFKALKYQTGGIITPNYIDNAIIVNTEIEYLHDNQVVTNSYLF